MLYRKLFLQLSVVVACLMACTLVAVAADRFITVASTTSTENSGLFRHLLPLFQQDTGIEVRVVAVGTGQAIELAQRGDADVLFVHHKPSEEKFVAEGHGVKRFEVSRDLRSQFLAASRDARDRLGPKLVSPELLQHVMSLLADWRAEHERR